MLSNYKSSMSNLNCSKFMSLDGRAMPIFAEFVFCWHRFAGGSLGLSRDHMLDVVEILVFLIIFES
jgi:hypothetical protein